jgi:hypothetical protein
MVIALSLAILFAIITDRRDYDAATKAQSWSTRPDVNIDANTATSKGTKKNCQIIYVLGVEGATHTASRPFWSTSPTVRRTKYRIDLIIRGANVKRYIKKIL